MRLHRVFEFVVEYADIITKSDVTHNDLEELKDAMDSIANFTDSMKDLLGGEIIQDLVDKQKDAQEQMDNITDVGAGSNNMFGIFMVMLLCLNFIGILTILGKKLKADLIK